MCQVHNVLLVSLHFLTRLNSSSSVPKCAFPFILLIVAISRGNCHLSCELWVWEGTQECCWHFHGDLAWPRKAGDHRILLPLHLQLQNLSVGCSRPRVMLHWGTARTAWGDDLHSSFRWPSPQLVEALGKSLSSHFLKEFLPQSGSWPSFLALSPHKGIPWISVSSQQTVSLWTASICTLTSSQILESTCCVQLPWHHSCLSTSTTPQLQTQPQLHLRHGCHFCGPANGVVMTFCCCCCCW